MIFTTWYIWARRYVSTPRAKFFVASSELSNQYMGDVREPERGSRSELALQDSFAREIHFGTLACQLPVQRWMQIATKSWFHTVTLE